MTDHSIHAPPLEEDHAIDPASYIEPEPQQPTNNVPPHTIHTHTSAYPMTAEQMLQVLGTMGITFNMPHALTPGPS